MSSDGFEFDDIDLGEIEAIENHYTLGTALPPRTAVNKPGLVQRDLFGAAVLPPPPPKPKGGGGGGATRTVVLGGPNAAGSSGETKAKTKVTKRWDAAAFAKHGWSKKNAAVAKAKARGGGGKGKGKKKDYGSDEEPWDEDQVLDDDDDEGSDGEEFLVDTTYDPNAPILPIKWPPDPQASKTFVYPVQADKPLRVYQYNIVQSALYKNTLVSLPTGLGKTFIAACVMLNFYRWYPRGKVLFLAPTRPLVTQQIKACHYIAGIPQEDCIELTGGTQPKLRSLGWATKRVIYSTPQTVERDLAKGRLDPRDVTLVVVDEAHRASGDYSYCGVIRYMMCRNPHFRVLALTATPGARGEAVQEVIDNLHIGHIEVRADDSIDIRQYIHKKSFDLTVLPLGPGLSALRDKWANLMKTYIGPLLAARLIYSGDAVMLSAFAVQQAYQKMKGLPGGSKGNGKYFPMIKTLAQMCRAMEYLVIQSVTSFESSIKDIQANGLKSLVSSSGFKQVVSEVAAIRGREGYVGHPKMEKLRTMCLEHFEATKDDVDEYTGEKRETRVMIFCNFRAVVEEIVACLNTQRPLIKATPFVGQASSKGTKGKSQKEQLETIKKFKKGIYNVLVATSIGEEGLDIGEIDLIVCYEANKSPIRMLQRVGRTGRARDGHIIVLMSEGREERNWDKANDAYNEVQNALTSNKIFELYADCERLLPDNVKPACEKVEIKAQPLNVDAMTMNGQSRAERKFLAEEKKNNKQKARDPRMNMPNDAFDGFRSAGQLAVASKSKPPSTSQTLRERKVDALLTTDEEATLRKNWMVTAAGDPARTERFYTDELPFERGMSGSAHRITKHGQRHLDLLSALRTTSQLADGKSEALDTWTDKLSVAFKPNLVEIFKREDNDPLPRLHPRLRRNRIQEEEEEDLAVTFPALTGYPIPRPSSTMSSPPAALFRPSSPHDLSSPPVNRNKKRLLSSPRPPSPKRPRLSSDAAPLNRSETETIDLSGVISSDDENLQLSRRSSPRSFPSPHLSPAPPSLQDPPSPTLFSLDLDGDDEMNWSESELLKGAVIRGKSNSVSISPPQAKTKGSEAIVIDDSDEENHQQEQVVPLPAAPRKPPAPSTVLSSKSNKLSTGPPPSRTVSAPSFRPTAVVPDTSPEILRTKSASNLGGFKPFIPPRPSTSQPKSSPAAKPRPSSPPLRSSPPMMVLDDSPEPRPLDLPQAQEEAEDDEFAFFDDDMPSDFLDQVNISQIPSANIRGRPTVPDDDSIIMPPPPPSVKRPQPVPPFASKRRLVVPNSSSDVPASPAPPSNPGFRPAKALLPPDINFRKKPTTTISQAKPPQLQSMRRLAVPDSSSPAIASGSKSVAIVTRRAREGGGGGPQEEEDELSIISTGVSKKAPLNRLRRGGSSKQVIVSDNEDEIALNAGELDNSPPPAAPSTKKKKEKRKRPSKPILTHKLAAKFGIFDTEAINSSASGSEASSEDYDSENSIDREFVARHDDEDEDEGDSGFVHQAFYQTQAGGGGGDGPRFENEPGWVTKRSAWADPSRWAQKGKSGARAERDTQDTPGGQDASQWSYDSFCVPDDEEIEYDESQSQAGGGGGGGGSSSQV